MYVIFTDTDTDTTPEIAAKYGYKLISMPYSIDGKSVTPYVDFEKFDSKTYYDTLRGGVVPNTGAISKEKYIEYFEPVFSEGKDILYVHFSAAMSATFEVMNKAYEELILKYPERKLYTVDTKGISALSLNIVEEIGDLYLAGKSAEEILAWAEKEVDKFTLYFFADDLKFFKHSGRVSGLAATMGTLLGVRPIIYVNEEGKMVTLCKEKGRAKAMARLLSYVEALGEEVTSHRIIIGHTDAEDIANDIASALREKYGEDLKLEISVVNPTIGAHCGPSGVGISFHAAHR